MIQSHKSHTSVDAHISHHDVHVPGHKRYIHSLSKRASFLCCPGNAGDKLSSSW